MKDFKLYVILDRNVLKHKSYIQQAYEAVKGGADIIQLRDKRLSDRELIKSACDIAKVTSENGKIFIINDRVDIAYASNADGVHLGQDDMPVDVARKILGRNKIIGKSTHSIKQAMNAQDEGVDYIGVGPVFSTPTKPNYKAVGLSLIRQVKNMINIPFVAIGGINSLNIGEVISAGAKRIAVVRAVVGAENIETAAKEFKEVLK